MASNHRLWLANVPPPMLRSRTRKMLYFTSSLVNSRPLCQTTPLRRLILICLKSWPTSQVSASSGCGCNWSSYDMSRSYTVQRFSNAGGEMPCTSRLLRSTEIAERSTPRDFGCRVVFAAPVPTGVATEDACPALTVAPAVGVDAGVSVALGAVGNAPDALQAARSVAPAANAVSRSAERRVMPFVLGRTWS